MTVTDAVVLSHWADGVIVVLDQKNTSRQGIQRARENPQAAAVRIQGAGGSGGYFSYCHYRDDAATAGNGKTSSGGRKWLGLVRNGKPKSRLSKSAPASARINWRPRSPVFEAGPLLLRAQGNRSHTAEYSSGGIRCGAVRDG